MRSFSQEIRGNAAPVNLYLIIRTTESQETLINFLDIREDAVHRKRPLESMEFLSFTYETHFYCGLGHDKQKIGSVS